jgi:hypothetical protein
MRTVVVRSTIDSMFSILFALVFWGVLFIIMASKIHDAKLELAADTNASTQLIQQKE